MTNGWTNVDMMNEHTNDLNSNNYKHINMWGWRLKDIHIVTVDGPTNYIVVWRDTKAPRSVRIQRWQLQNELLCKDFLRGHMHIDLVLFKPLMLFHWPHRVSSIHLDILGFLSLLWIFDNGTNFVIKPMLSKRIVIMNVNVIKSLPILFLRTWPKKNDNSNSKVGTSISQSFSIFVRWNCIFGNRYTSNF